jgi:DNA-binding NtrC family response regulator
MNSNEMDLTHSKVLLVDDQRENVDVLVGILKPKGYDIRVALSGAVALDLAQRFSPDLILLDVMMPDMDGFEMCRQLKTDPSMHDTPVIFLTALSELKNVVEGFRSGGVDYISKPFRDEELLMRVSTHLKLRRALKEVETQNEMLKAEIARSEALTKERDQLSEERDQLAGRMSMISDEEVKRWGIAGFVGQSAILRQILGDVERLQQAGSTSVLITGESGTGKELIARALHFGSDRASGPFMPVNCSSVTGDLADSLFFGHKKGAFTGADQDRQGYFELAHGGTLFLDEIADMPLHLQAKLLRALEERVVLPVGGAREIAVDVRVVAATNADLSTEIDTGRFRQDLYFRLAGFPVQVPPLRERREDIPLLAKHFVSSIALEMGIDTPEITDSALSALATYDFPGNVRELKNAIERALIESGGRAIEPKHLHLSVVGEAGSTPSSDVLTGISVDDLPLNMEQAEWALIKRAMAQTNGNVARAARLLGINRMKIYRRLAAEEEASDMS